MSVFATVAVAGAAGLAVTFILGFAFVPWLGKLEFGDGFLRSDKNPAPSMGGIILAVGTVSAAILAVATDAVAGGKIIESGSLTGHEMYTKFWNGLLMAVAFSLVGLIDDYFKIRTRQSIGLTVKQKTVMEFFVILAYLTGLYMGMNGKPYMFIPFIGNTEPGFFYWIIGIMLIYGTVNSADITDGIGGMSSNIMLTSAVSLGVIAALKGLFGFSVMSAAAAGSCLGFILWNKRSAKVHMGKTGTLFCGGMITALSYAIGCPLAVLLAGLSYFIIGLSDVVQIAYYKRTGRPLLKNAPVQHHLKLIGWSDKKITLTFTAVNILGGAAAVFVMYYGGYILR